MKFGLVLTNDWELFGDGRGDYWEVQHWPLAKLLKTVHDQGARLTVMAEVGQHWAFQRLGEREPWAREICDGWENILQQTVREGSDVQLHLHPQWLNARYEHENWLLDYAEWAISSLSPERMEQALVRGKHYLDDLLQLVDPAYECLAFRAGAYCLMPSNVVVQKLRRAGLCCDSSVTRGLYNPGRFDFRDAPSHVRPWYSAADDILRAEEDGSGVLELPICSIRALDSAILRRILGERRYNRIRYGVRTTDREEQWSAENKTLLRSRYPVSFRPQRGRRFADPGRLKWLASKCLSRRTIQLDYDFLSPGMFVRCLRTIANDIALSRECGDMMELPIIASGHVKTMHNTDNVKRILEMVRREFPGQVEFRTLAEVVRDWSGPKTATGTAKVVDKAM